MEKNKAEKNKSSKGFMTILIIITVFCILFGSARYLFGGALSGSAGKKETRTGTAEAFDSADLDIEVGDVKIRTGSEYAWEATYPSKLMPEISVSGNTLKASQKTKKGIRLNALNADYELIITIPEDKELESVNADLDMGAFHADDVTSGSMDLRLDMGSLDLNRCTIDLLEADADMGSITVSDCTLKDASLNADMGSINISGSFEALTAKCSMGSIDVKTDRPITDEKVSLDADMGSITVNGQKQGNSYSN